VATEEGLLGDCPDFDCEAVMDFEIVSCACGCSFDDFCEKFGDSVIGKKVPTKKRIALAFFLLFSNDATSHHQVFDYYYHHLVPETNHLFYRHFFLCVDLLVSVGVLMVCRCEKTRPF